jgi:uncharacterized membrane protein YoaT (DUF817 family)
VGVAWLGSSAINYLTSHFFPGLRIQVDLFLLLTYGVSAVGYGVAHLRRKLWRNAFLCLALVPVVVLMWLGFSSIFGTGTFIPLWFLAILFLIPERSPVPRFEFLVACLIAIAVVVFASGLVGTGELARDVLTCTGVAGFALFAIRMRRLRATDDRDTPPAIV